MLSLKRKHNTIDGLSQQKKPEISFFPSVFGVSHRQRPLCDYRRLKACFSHAPAQNADFPTIPVTKRKLSYAKVCENDIMSGELIIRKG